MAENPTGIYLLTLVELLNFLTQETSLLVLFYKEVKVLSKVTGVELMYLSSTTLFVGRGISSITT